MKKNFSATSLVHGAFIAALYIILTYLANALSLANGIIQIRFSEALCILPLFTPAAIWGLFAGCLISNFLTGCVLIDVILGSIATLIGAIGTRLLKKKPLLSVLPPIIANVLIIPPVLAYVYKFEGSIWYFALTVGIGEIISCGMLGLLLYKVLAKYKTIIFK
ncbi:MAG: QueT transporter family protein [Lachnospiraceae bacterium]|nr:QueT transporter family protein [Lachnospiraceae bacterium]